jgi:hypothetical protein
VPLKESPNIKTISFRAFVDNRAMKIDFIATLSGLESHPLAAELLPFQSRLHQY